MSNTITVIPHLDSSPTEDQSQPRRDRGFTLIEIMAVVIIMGLLMGAVGVSVLNQLDTARQFNSLLITDWKIAGIAAETVP